MTEIENYYDKMAHEYIKTFGPKMCAPMYRITATLKV